MRHCHCHLLWFVLAGTGTLSAQGVAEMTATLAAAETVDTAMVGHEGGKSPTYRTYERWRERATTDELLACTRHERATVRAYAVRALVELEAAVDWPTILHGFLRDTAEVTTFAGCCLARQMVGDVCFDTVRPRLETGQLQDFAEAAIRGKSPLYAREWALRHLRLRDGMLHHVRALARDGEAAAGIALARYRLDADVAVLAQLLRRERPFDENAQLLAAAIHAGPELLAPLIALETAARHRLTFDNPSRLRFWLQAIAVHRNDTAGAFLARFLRTATPDGEWQRRDLLRTMQATIEPYADVSAFAEVRTEVARRQAAERDR